MSNLSQNYQLRKCFLAREQVPTQSTIIKAMSPPLASVYFKSMGPKHKVMAGLEPPLKGGGSNWYMPPKDILDGRHVLKPIDSKSLAKLSFLGVDEIGMKLIDIHRNRMRLDRKRIMHESEQKWRKAVEDMNRREWERASAEASEANTLKIQHLYNEFAYLYAKSLTQFQEMLYDAAVNKIKSYRQETFQKIQPRYEYKMQQQAAKLYDAYTKKLNDEKKFLKNQFITNLEEHRTVFCKKLHDINVEKKVAVEKLRHYLECQTLACQVYVALRERAECAKQIELAKTEQSKKIKDLTSKMNYIAFELHHAKEKEKAKTKFTSSWEKKVCHVVKTLQTFVLYCLKTVPEHAEFFINMEKLLMLQLSKALEEPTVESIIEPDIEYNTPVALPRPFYVFRDSGKHTMVHSHLCPKHVTSSATQMPVIVVNKRCIYANCDNFEKFSDKIQAYDRGERGDDVDFEDDHDYSRNLNVTYTSSQQLNELKLQSSLLQVLQQEIANLDEVPIECGTCQVPQCFCYDMSATAIVKPRVDEKKTEPPIILYKKISTRKAELEHEREPKWDSYMNFVKPKVCDCSKLAKDHLFEHLPAYMRKMSAFESPEIANYEKCTVSTLKKLVKKAQGVKDPVKVIKPPSKTRDIAIQCSDYEFDYLCECISDQSVKHFLDTLITVMKPTQTDFGSRQFRVIDGALSPSTAKSLKSFASERVLSLRRLIDQEPDIIDIFERQPHNC